MVCCTAFLGTAAGAQDVARTLPSGADPYSLDAAMQGPALPSLGEFHVEYSRRAATDFTAPLPEVQPEAWAPPKPNWIDPSLQIAGAKLKPDIKHRGLKVAFQIWNADDVDEDEPNPN